MKYDALFTPFKIGNMEEKSFCYGTNGELILHILMGCIANDEIDYFEARAKGGLIDHYGMSILNPDF